MYDFDALLKAKRHLFTEWLEDLISSISELGCIFDLEPEQAMHFEIQQNTQQDMYQACRLLINELSGDTLLYGKLHEYALALPLEQDVLYYILNIPSDVLKPKVEELMHAQRNDIEALKGLLNSDAVHAKPKLPERSFSISKLY